jgi:hypothetical protein
MQNDIKFLIRQKLLVDRKILEIIQDKYGEEDFDVGYLLILFLRERKQIKD